MASAQMYIYIYIHTYIYIHIHTYTYTYNIESISRPTSVYSFEIYCRLLPFVNKRHQPKVHERWRPSRRKARLEPKNTFAILGILREFENNVTNAKQCITHKCRKYEVSVVHARRERERGLSS